MNINKFIHHRIYLFYRTKTYPYLFTLKSYPGTRNISIILRKDKKYIKMLGVLSITSFSIFFGYKLNDLLRKNFYASNEGVIETNIDYGKSLFTG